MSQEGLRKQISIFVDPADWKAIRREASRRQLPITELVRQWIEPECRRLKKSQAAFDEEVRNEQIRREAEDECGHAELSMYG